MGELCVPSKALTSLDDVRHRLDGAERTLSQRDPGASETLNLLHLFDQIDRKLR